MQVDPSLTTEDDDVDRSSISPKFRSSSVRMLWALEVLVTTDDGLDRLSISPKFESSSMKML